jgi:hypothetical protein
MPHMRYVAFSYSDTITTRDNNKMVRLVTSAPYRQLWGDRFFMIHDQDGRAENREQHAAIVWRTRRPDPVILTRQQGQRPTDSTDDVDARR